MVGEYIDIPRVYTAIAEWITCFIYCMIIPRKISRIRFGLYSAFSLAGLVLWLHLTGSVNLYLWVPCMMVAIFIMFDYLMLVLELDILSVLFITAKAFLVAEFIASLEWQLEYFYDVTEAFDWISLAILAVTYSLAAVLLYRLEKWMYRSSASVVISVKELNMAALIVILSFAVSNLNFVYKNTPFSSRFVTDIFLTRTLIDLVGLALLYAYQMRLCELSREQELSSINAMLKTQYDHYRNYQQNVDLINFKYHDLKHQIAGLKAEMNPQKREEWLNQLEEELESYRPETQTGNHVLDGILDAKRVMIRNNKIKFTCVADGALLGFMHVTDICTIFGNALDNAIESVVTVEDPEKRVIHMSVSAKKQFLYITVQNYCDHEVKFINGSPVTSKRDRSSHGFGTKSIAYTAEKYGGSVSYRLQKDFFYMNILIPLLQETAVQ